MKFKDFKAVLSVTPDMRVVVTCLAYSRKTNEYYSFRTAFDNGEEDADILDSKYAYMNDYDVKGILVGENTVWIDLYELVG